MRVMSAGDGYSYLLRSVAAGDGDRSLSTPLTRYYTEAGTPPGRWLGGGLASLGEGRVAVGDRVSEAELQLLVGMGRDPVTGAPLGRAYPVYAPVRERVADRLAALDLGLSARDRGAAVAAIQAEEAARGLRRAVAGFDFTFSMPKSASVLWAVADACIQKLIVEAHHAAVADVVAFMEREVAATRAGATGGDGAVAQVEVTGLIAAAFDHYDSRAGDPHLHTHVVVSNKVQTVFDGKWRALDGRPLHAATVALSELHEAVFADRLSRTLGVQWEQHRMGADRNPSWAIRGVSEALVAEFSSRSRHIDVETDRLIEEYRATRGRRPSPAVVLKLRAQATLATRPEKEIRALADLTRQWRERAGAHLGEDATTWARTVVAGAASRVLRAEDVPMEVIGQLGRRVVEVVGEKRSTWRHWNLYAEAARQTMGLRFATIQGREAMTALIVEAAESASIRLTPHELAATPAMFQRPDGTSVFRPRHSVVFSSTALLKAEDRLLALSRDATAPVLPVHRVQSQLPDARGRRLRQDQIAALRSVASSGRVVDVLVGPAGAGKTTAMQALRHAWESEYGVGSVVGLAPSATAAEVLASELRIRAENTAKWWHDHQAGRTAFKAGQLVILDEASLAGTLTLRRIADRVKESGAKLLLVGDWAQLSSVEAGGAFALLVEDRVDSPELDRVERFTHDWEKTASLELRHGAASVIDLYEQHGRVVGGAAEDMAEAAYRAWRSDLAAGRTSILIADDGGTVTELNRRARADLILAGAIDATSEVALHDGTAASVGDIVLTRRNDRRLRAGKDWVRNGARWRVTKIRADGSLQVRREGRAWGGALVLPAGYVSEHLELGYAVTAHRAQGVTTDTSHALVQPSSSRESLYVAMTRGRGSNTAYVITDRPDDYHTELPPGNAPQGNAKSVLTAVLGRSAAHTSAHQSLAAQQDAWGSIAQLAAEYDTIAAAAQHDRWTALIRSTGLTAVQAEQVISSPAFAPLTAQLRRAEAHHHDVDRLLPQLVDASGTEDTDDLATLLHHRLTRAISSSAGTQSVRRADRLIAGLIPAATGPMTAEMRDALAQRGTLIEQRAAALVDAALAAREPWITSLGAPPTDRHALQAWRRDVRVIAAYRDRYRITSRGPLGPNPETAVQQLDAAHATAALHRARNLPTWTPVGPLGPVQRSHHHSGPRL
ncbi:MobF family relaxase [Naasia sp. SYSU D00948]|uniref:MobF family relaxase n=1 Tax=Naasia sp. SYSU D00948 TaxID=2817379 RepID=UPI001FEF72F6|nr:MobF family relaxase [Naasia sp. SYSU D00948]